MTVEQVVYLSREFTLKEQLQVRERIRGKRLPLFVIQENERNEHLSRLWRIPGTDVRVDLEGNIYYPVWRERTRIIKPELYHPCSELPRGWSFARLLASERRPISEVIFCQVKKDEGAIEMAIRSMDHVLERYTNKGKELAQVEVVERQINQALSVLATRTTVSKEEFEEGFESLYKTTLELLEKCGLSRAVSALKKDIARLLGEGSTGRDKTGRLNALVMLKKLEAAGRRVDYRRNEAGFIVDKFAAMKAGLVSQREKERNIFEQADHDLSLGFASHEAFKYPLSKEATKLQKGILMGKVGTLIGRLEKVKVKGYKPVAIEVIGKLEQARGMVKEGNFQQAKEILEKSRVIVSETLRRGEALLTTKEN